MKKRQGRGFEWSKEEIDDLTKMYRSTKMKDLAIYFGRSKTSVGRKALKLGLKRDPMVRDYNRIWTQKEEEYLKIHYEFGNLEKIAKKLNRTRKAVVERAKLLKLIRDKEVIRKQHQKHSINENFFSEWSNNMAYILGLFCADGNMGKNCNRISICLHKDDEYLVHKILKYMGSTHRVFICKNTANLSIDNLHLYNGLIKLGITPNKSKTLRSINVPKEFIPHFVRGVMDGDGSVDTKNKRMKISSASKDFANGLSDMLDKINIKHKVYNEPYMYNDTKVSFYSIRILRRKDIKKLYDMMYKYQRLYMIRKKEAFQKMGVKDKDFAIKYRNIMKPIVGKNIYTGEKIKFDSIKEACENGFCKQNLHRSLKGIASHHKNYTWRYVQKRDNNA